MVEVVQLANTKQEIHVEVKVHSSNQSWIFSVIYASPRSAERCILWENLAKVFELHNKPWVIAGDFNESLAEEDKFGGRFFMNSSWCLLYPDAIATHLTRCHSDHCPILKETNPRRPTQLSRPLRFQSFWLSDPSFPNVANQAWRQSRKLSKAMEAFSKEAIVWNKNHFRNIFGKKRRIMAQLRGIQMAMASNPSSSLIILEN
ncbi:uncharacterized protein LOC115980375 [Quercus lobata]|uniref:uncharacterized protein LOC115980375 n=1 Tax=Quercus lobata TaxID=97700 RepID=UPI001248CE5F|nr:uncharacterized protein LOC115980375 [Quercus lobata]